MRSPALVMLAALAGIGATSAPTAAQDGAARHDLARFEACAAILDDEARHRCLDDALRATGMIDPAEAEARRRANFGRSRDAVAEEAQRDATRAPGTPPAGQAEPALAARPSAPSGGADSATPPVAAAPAPPSSPPAPAQASARPATGDSASLQTRIAASRLIGRHTIQIATTDAGVWESTERRTFRRTPAAGDALEIIPAALGGYRCRLERTTIFPCHRLD